MKDDLKIFENRSDDWLAKEREYEETVSAWDFDEGKRIKEIHKQKHQAYEDTHKKGVIGARNNYVPLNNSAVIKTIIPLMLVAILCTFMGIFASAGIIEEDEIIFGIPIIIAIFASLLTKNKKEKK